MSECRNCGESDLQDLGPIGKISPFFLKRALGLELGYPVSPIAAKRWVRRLVMFRKSPLRRVSSQFAFVEIQICTRCSFLQTKRPFHDEDVMRLYLDYRSQTYNQERARYEPSYATVAERVGQDRQEVRSRTTALEAFLHRSLGSSHLLTILDYGGSDGRFIPAVPGQKVVFEVSDINPIPGVARINSEADLGKYSLVLLAHVIEHVPHPLQLVTKVAAHVEDSGFLYIETPQEIPDAGREGLRNGRLRFDVNIHEHINSYCIPSVRSLIEAAGLRVVAIESTEVDVGWTKAIHIRALGQRPSSH